MIWFDLDNSPHVPLFRPVLADLQSRGVETFVTSRDHAQTEDLLRLWGIPHVCVGKHGGKGKAGKILNLFQRSLQLRRAVGSRPVVLAVSHGSRTQMVAAASMRIKTLVMDDYEYSEQTLARHLADVILVPEGIPPDRLRESGFRMDRVVRYDGFKEETYLRDFVPDPSFRSVLGEREDVILALLRPPSVSANYHDSRSEGLFRACLDRLVQEPGVVCLIVNRTPAEMRLFPEGLRNSPAVHFLKKPVDGLQLLWASDLVISGGGTMNREAALLGIPTYSVFSGRRPAMDERLVERGRMKFIEDRNEVGLIPVVRRDRPAQFAGSGRNVAQQIAEVILRSCRRPA
jgi:predicted glycosyltransferase